MQIFQMSFSSILEICERDLSELSNIEHLDTLT